jgi:hypothetical protein
METGGLLANINWSVPTWDLFILLFFITAGILYGFTLGRARVLFILMSLYIGLAVASNLPFITEKTSQRFGLGSVSALRIIVFAACVVGLFILFTRLGALSSFSGQTSIFHIILFSFLHVGLLISIILSFLPETAVVSLAPLTKNVFTSDMGKFLWILAPIGAMFLVKKEEV